MPSPRAIMLAFLATVALSRGLIGGRAGEAFATAACVTALVALTLCPVVEYEDDDETGVA